MLASASPRRLELLSTIGIEPRVVPSAVDESLRPGEPPELYVARLAAAKAEAVQRLLGDPGQETAPVVLGADTIVCVEGRILGKPRDDADARAMLRALAGGWHRVVTAICALHVSDRWETTSTTDVRFRPLDDDEIDRYVATGEGRDKAGSYAVQGIGMGFVPEIRGSYANVVGLPIVETLALLREAGAVHRWP